MRKLLLASAFGLGLPVAAQATITFSATNDPQPSEQTIQFESPQTGTSFTGDTNKTLSPVIFDTTFTKDPASLGTGGDSSVLLGQGQGQSHLTCVANCPTPGTTRTLEMRPGGGTAWTDVIGNPSNGTGPVNVFARDNLGNNFDYTLTQGSNFFTLTAHGGEVITDVQITMVGSGGWTDFQQPRVSGVCTLVTSTSCTPIPFNTPEPAGMAVLGVGLLGLGFAVRYRRRSH